MDQNISFTNDSKKSIEQERKQLFYSWLESDVSLPLNIETIVLLSLKLQGVDINSIFSITDVSSIRRYITMFVNQRSACGINDDRTYQESLVFLSCYAEFLDEQNNRGQKRDLTEDSLTIAYFLAREDKKGLSLLGYNSFREAFARICTIIKQKPSTLKNMRDEFDPYCNNNRKGWYQRQLTASRKKVYDRYKGLSSDDFFAVIQEILSAYSQTDQQNGHKKIKISNSGMREIKTKSKF